MAYMMAGYPPGRDLEVLRGLARGGADIIEVGFPFSDPLADGPVIRDAAAESIRGGMDRKNLLEFVRRARGETDVPLVLMTYANVLYRRGLCRFMREAASAGIDGFIIPDLPVEEAAEYLECAKKEDAAAILLASPNTGPERMREIASASSGFLYVVAVYGTTGAAGGVKEYAVRAVRRALKESGGLPVGAGFGVSGPKDVARFVDAGADAVIVGSAILKLAGTGGAGLEGRIADFTAGLKQATIPRGRSSRSAGGAGRR
ncbi:tryptophan synthase alpha chain [Cenarchaeum symbiosum A]|uniref:Tryptophan synthase alpha chain n=1 Tax=Cenarchaeum symbiosum (strain A) TaxID=414004 RepID=A0RX31_CENSY|nr:tryptophan synthase alpha chain [Cenarchaeum symbiosum A]